uniref:N-acetylmuramoyl-L-alanine amidase n=1 Tax=Candidatus Profftia sp. (ex Adelges kitamiensis) TaxID=2864218 RepID=UPI001CE2C27B|nr:N-acetylmuramoyl-L-alanine amidase [Candidatus Profftia sp. (ex Adelges kitamiensis)]
MYIYKKFCIIIWLCFIESLLPKIVNATQITNIKVLNGQNEAKVILIFDKQPTYTCFAQSRLNKVLVYITKTKKISRGLPMKFSKNNILSCIHTGKNLRDDTIQVIFDVTRKIKLGILNIGKLAIFTIKYDVPAISVKSSLNNIHISTRDVIHSNTIITTCHIKKHQYNTTKTTLITKKTKPIITALHRSNCYNFYKIVVAIDAGHGGQDPGAVGSHGIYEKNITLSIAKRLQNLMNNDKIFYPILTRTGDYFIPVIGRAEVARKKQANLLISIHSDAAPNHNVSGSSVWLLSDRRANNEMANWLEEQHDKKTKLLGGASDVLANNSHDKYLSQAVIDLQFGHSQRVGTDVAIRVIREMKLIGNLHKIRPEYASLGVLRSPDIPSLLVETGFISNNKEERLLNSSAYQEKIAKAIYNGVRKYFLEHPLQSSHKIANRSKVLI